MQLWELQKPVEYEKSAERLVDIYQIPIQQALRIIQKADSDRRRQFLRFMVLEGHGLDVLLPRRRKKAISAKLKKQTGLEQWFFDAGKHCECNYNGYTIRPADKDDIL